MVYLKAKFLPIASNNSPTYGTHNAKWLITVTIEGPGPVLLVDERLYPHWNYWSSVYYLSDRKFGRDPNPRCMCWCPDILGTVWQAWAVLLADGDLFRNTGPRLLGGRLHKHADSLPQPISVRNTRFTTWLLKKHRHSLPPRSARHPRGFLGVHLHKRADTCPKMAYLSPSIRDLPVLLHIHLKKLIPTNQTEATRLINRSQATAQRRFLTESQPLH